MTKYNCNTNVTLQYTNSSFIIYQHSKIPLEEYIQKLYSLSKGIEISERITQKKGGEKK